MEVSSWENHLFLWVMASMAMLNNQMVERERESGNIVGYAAINLKIPAKTLREFQCLL